MMNFSIIYKCILCSTLLVITPIQEADAQTGRIVKVVKSAVNKSSTTVNKWLGRKAAKETTEEVLEQGTKALSKEITQRTIIKNAVNSILDPAVRINNNTLQEVTVANIKNTLKLKIGKEINESALKTASKEFAQQIGKSIPKDAQAHFFKRLGTETSQETYELSAKKSMQKRAFEAKKSYNEKIIDFFQKRKLYLLQTIKKSKIHKELLDIYAKGTFSLTEKELTALLANPQYFRNYMKAKIGKKDVIEFLIRLKMNDPKRVKQILDNPELSAYIKKSIRGNKRSHEWLMVKNIENFLLDPRWGENGDFLALALRKFTQKTDNILFKAGGQHSSTNSGKFHNGLSTVIDQSSSVEELFINIKRYAKQNLTPDKYNEFLGILESVVEAA